MDSVPRSGAPLHAAILGVSDLAASLRLYSEGVGLEVLERGTCEGAPFRQHFALPAGAEATYAVLADRSRSVGRIVLIEFHPKTGERIRNIADGRGYGLINLNFYAEDIHASTRRLESFGCRAWAKPVEHRVDAATGAPIEVMLDAPDGLILNLVELGEADAATRVGRMRRFVKEENGYTAAGLTPVVTTQHCVRDLEAASRFYEAVCGMTPYFDAVLDGTAQNLFHRYEPDTCSDVRFMIGNHLFGKVALIRPRNHHFAELASRAAPPATGYLAQSFIVADAQRAASAALGCGAGLLSPVLPMVVPGLGRARACMVRCPGSGALVELVEPLQ